MEDQEIEDSYTDQQARKDIWFPETVKLRTPSSSLVGLWRSSQPNHRPKRTGGRAQLARRAP